MGFRVSFAPRRSCPLWVKSRHEGLKPRCLLLTQKQTLPGDSWMSAKRHYEPYALQHRGSFRSLTMNDCLAARSSRRERSFSAPRYRLSIEGGIR